MTLKYHEQSHTRRKRHIHCWNSYKQSEKGPSCCHFFCQWLNEWIIRWMTSLFELASAQNSCSQGPTAHSFSDCTVRTGPNGLTECVASDRQLVAHNHPCQKLWCTDTPVWHCTRTLPLSTALKDEAPWSFHNTTTGGPSRDWEQPCDGYSPCQVRQATDTLLVVHHGVWCLCLDAKVLTVVVVVLKLLCATIWIAAL